jgi:hypothetical protein
VHTADDDSVPVPHDAFRLPRAVLNWKTPTMGGVAARNQRAAHDAKSGPAARRDAFDEMGELDELEDEPTRMVQVYVPRTPERALAQTPERPDPVKLALAAGQAALARGAELWREGPLRTAAMLAGIALITYVAVAGLHQGTGLRQGNSGSSQTMLAPAAALPTAAPIVVEQLNGVQRPTEMAAAPATPPAEPSDRARTHSSGSRARETSFSAAPVSRSSSYQSVAPTPSRSKSRRAERSGTSASSGSSGLPAWGAEAVREFSGASTSKSTPVSARSSQALTAKPFASSATAPASVAGTRPTATVPVREPAKPVPVAAVKPVAPPKPAAPPPPSKPLTMDQVLNRVEDAAKEQRKKAGLHAPKTSKRDAELDELISGSMKKK